MGVEEFRIEIPNNPELTFRSGDTILGILHLTTDKDYKNEGKSLLLYWSPIHKMYLMLFLSACVP